MSDPGPESIEIEAFVTSVRRRWGYDFAGYSAPSLRRRLRRAVDLEGLESISQLQGRVLQDRAALERFVGHLSVGYTSMFRDPEVYARIREQLVPVLRTWPFIRIWHAGCSTGEEVYSLAILLEEEGLYDRCRIYATDLSEVLLERARRGVFPLRVMKEYTQQYLRSGGQGDFSRWYAADARSAVFDPSLRRNIVFSAHNLVSDGVFNQFHFIMCRNVLIYFSAPPRDQVHRLLAASLERFGYLCLGTKEAVAHTPVADLYEEVFPDERIFRRRA